MKKRKQQAKSQRITWRQWAVIGGLMSLLLVFGVIVNLADASWLRQVRQAQAGGETPDGMITVIGEVICLPHRDKAAPQTEECAIGVKDRGGYNYAIGGTPLKADAGKVTVTGKPVPATSNEKYDIIGTVIPR